MEFIHIAAKSKHGNHTLLPDNCFYVVGHMILSVKLENQKFTICIRYKRFMIDS
jgi:hypothetical protein